MGRLKVKIPKGKEVAWFVRQRWTDRARYLTEKRARELHPDLPRPQVGSTTYSCLYPDEENHTAYAIVFQHLLFPKPRLPRRRKGEDEIHRLCRIPPESACFLGVLEYLEKEPLIYLEWIIDAKDSLCSKTDAHKVYGAFQFDPLKAIEFYARECKRVYGGITPRRYYPAPSPKVEAKPKLRRLDLADER